jgi:hypothetical protein
MNNHQSKLNQKLNELKERNSVLLDELHKREIEKEDFCLKIKKYQNENLCMGKELKQQN